MSVNGTQHYDAAIIGAGQGGKPIAMAAAGYGTAIIEREHVGGSCVNQGCTPTKTMVASAWATYLTRRASDPGVGTARVSMDMEPGPWPALGGRGPYGRLIGFVLVAGGAFTVVDAGIWMLFGAGF